MENQFYVSSAPHISDKDTVQKIMFDVVLALVPAMIASIYFFGVRAGLIILITVAACMTTEAAIQRLMKKPITISDGSAIVTGILLAFNLPAKVPWWLPVIGSVFAIAIGKHAFGGLGYNPMNPALLGRAFLLASWPEDMTSSIFVPAPGETFAWLSIDGFTSATPLEVMKNAQKILAEGGDNVTNAAKAVSELTGSYDLLFWGRVGGCLGETSAFALLIGAIYLLYKRRIGFKIPLTYIGTVALLTWIFGSANGLFKGDPIFHVLAGGLILGAFFVATDMVTSPVTFWGHIVFGIGCGVITVIIRLIGGYPEGVSYSILLMNLTVPLLDKFTKPKIFGEVKAK